MGSSQSFPMVTLNRDKVVVVTGGNTGIGYEAAKWIAMMGAHVIIACRSEEKATKAIEKMNAEFLKEKEKDIPGLTDTPNLDVTFMHLDCASLKSTQDFIDNFKSRESRLHLLLLNAGIAMHKQEYTEDGNEIMFQVNYLSQFLISAKLLPMMKESGEDCRIILVSTDLHIISSFDVDHVQGKEYTTANFDRMLYYGRSKLYQIMQMYSFNKRLEGSNVTVNCIHPGIVETEMDRNFSDLQRWKVFLRLLKLIGVSKTPYEGAKTLVNAAVNPQFKDTRNAYHKDCKASTSSSASRNTMHQKELWDYTVNYLSQFLISAKLLPMMKESGEDCRIILVSTDLHIISSFDVDHVQGKEYTTANFDRMLYYGRSKLYQIMQMYSFNKRLEGSNVTVNCIHPGIVETEMDRNFSDLQRWKVFLRLLKLIGVSKTPYEGAKTLVNAAVNPQFKDTRNAYHKDCKASTSSSASRNTMHQKELWDYTVECLKDYLTSEDIEMI